MLSSDSDTFEDKLRAAVQMPQPSPEFLATMRANLITESPHTISFGDRLWWMFRRPLVVVSMILLLLVAGFLIAGPQRVFAAVFSLFGYIPDVGIVDTSMPMRVLAEPVSDSRGGFNLTVESTLLDSTQTVIQYRIAGPFPARDSHSPGSNLCQSAPLLRLADSTELAYSAGEMSGGNGQMSYKVTFPALAAGQDQATLFLPCVQGQMLGEPPLDWEIPLRFIPAPPGLPVYPVVDLPTLTPLFTGKNEPANGFNLSLEQMAEIPEGYYLKARLDWQADLAFYQVQLFPDSVRVVDSAGQSVNIIDLSPEVSTGSSLSFTLNIDQPAHPGPVQINVEYVALDLPPQTDTSITIDVGENPQPGQTWQVNQDLTVHGYTLRVLSAEYFQESPLAPVMLMLNLQAEPKVLLARFMDFEHELEGGGAGSPNNSYTQFRAALTYKEFPKGKITLSAPSISVRREGPWSANWEPPTVDPGTPPRQLANPVTDSRDGYTLTVNNVVLNALGSTVTYTLKLPQPITSQPGLQTDTCLQKTSLRLADGREKISTDREGSGTELEMQYTETFPAFRADETPISLVISCLHLLPKGAGPQNWEIPLQFVPGAPATLTPAPTFVPVSNPACLDQAKLEAALEAPLMSMPAGVSGKMAFWQGDGQVGEMAVSSLDGSQRLTLGPGLFPALAPDKQHVVYRNADSGLHLRSLANGTDILIADSIEPGVFNNNPAWSPDGQLIAFTRFANENSDLYLVNADGSNLHPLVASPEQETFLGWAPDSREIVYSLYKGEIHHLFVIDLPSGKSREIRTLPSGTTFIALSPDGKRLAYGTAQGIYIANTNDFVPTFWLDNAFNLSLPLIWSPDSQWLALGYWGKDGKGPASLALFQPDTCQMVIFKEPSGIFSSWVP
jgi:hypothetical protein